MKKATKEIIFYTYVLILSGILGVPLYNEIRHVMDEEKMLGFRREHSIPVKNSISKEHYMKVFREMEAEILYLQDKLSFWKRCAQTKTEELGKAETYVQIASDNCIYLQDLVNKLHGEIAELKQEKTKEIVGEKYKKTIAVESAINDPSVIFTEWTPQKGSKLNP